MLAVKLWPVVGLLLWHLINHSTGNALFSLLDGSSVYNPPASSALEYKKNLPKIKLTPKEINETVEFSKSAIERVKNWEINFHPDSTEVEEGTPQFGQLIESRTDQECFNQGIHAVTAARASVHLKYKNCYNGGDKCNEVISHLTMYNTPLHEACRAVDPVDCDSSSIYRSYDGTCNNPDNSIKGKSFSGYKRLLPPAYTDGIEIERKYSVKKGQLPNPRVVSYNIGKDPIHRVFVHDSMKTLAFMQWGQFIEQDLAHTGFRRFMSNGKPIQCCGEDGFVLSPRYRHPDACMHIDIHDDPVYSKNFVFCMNYVRSQPAVREGCTFGYMNQMNQATHFLDGSNIYGTTKKVSKSLREMTGGRLQTFERNGLQYPPMSNDPQSDCQVGLNQKQTVCFRAGDSRVNIHPQLSVFYTLFVREHNRIAKSLEKLNPNWDDEKLYQEARRIVIAEIQHITYEHWKPLLLGSNEIEYRMENDDRYDNSIDPLISNSFATAAIRFLNTLMTDRISLVNEDGKIEKSLNLSEHYNKPQIIVRPGHLDSILRGLIFKRCEQYDLNISPELKHRLFIDGSSFGYDILTLDIQRSRDHGLPSYNDYREICGFPKVSKIREMSDTISIKNVKVLESIYAHPGDIDLIVGLLAESPKGNSFVGPVLSCLFKDQLDRTRAGDRFFYTHANQPHPFTSAQLNQLRQVTLARLFCDNSDNLTQIQPNVFEKINDQNPLVSCSNEQSIPKLNLSAWRSTA